MAITFLQEKKKQRYLMLILVAAIFVILFVVWQGFLQKKETLPTPVTPVVTPTTVKIDWPTLEDPQLKILKLFEEIGEFKEEIGRANPFLPY